MLLALGQREPGRELRVWARRESSLAPIAATGRAALVTADLAAAVHGAGMVVLCTPVETMADLAAGIAPHLAPDAVVTDAGSVKGSVVAACEPILGPRFVGAHPIAGSDRSGFDAATADLYEEATCIITPTDVTDASAIDATRDLWATVGCRLVTLTPAAHDAALARTSHLPHAAASALAIAIERHLPGAWPELAGGGYRDTTRVALGHEDLWTGILLANRREVATSIAELTEILQNVRAAIESGDAEATRHLLAEGRSARQKFDVF